MTAGRIAGLSVSAGGVPKHPIDQAEVGPPGLAGDDHRDRRAHGGPERALCLYSVEQIARLRAEGHDVAAGFLGENVTTEGIDLGALAPGTRLRLGADVEIEITRDTTPCSNLARYFVAGRFGRISHKTNPRDTRWYARVLRGGVVRVGDPVVPLVQPEEPL